MFLLTTLALAGALYLRRAPVDTRVYRSTFVPPANADVGLRPNDLLALSPDGRRLAFVAPDANGRVVLWVRALADLAAQPLAGTEGAAGPFWSPDSRFIAFSAGGKLKKIDASGGPAISLCDTNTSYAGSWGRGDVILFTPANDSGLSRVAAAGGTPTLATTLDTKGGEQWHAYPFFLPDGRHFLYAAAGDPTSGVYVGSLDSPDRTRLLDSFANAQYASGFLVFPRAGTLMAQPFDATRLALSGEARRWRNRSISLGGRRRRARLRRLRSRTRASSSLKHRGPRGSSGSIARANRPGSWATRRGTGAWCTSRRTAVRHPSSRPIHRRQLTSGSSMWRAACGRLSR